MIDRTHDQGHYRPWSMGWAGVLATVQDQEGRSTVDKREGQAIGAAAHGLPEAQCPDRVHAGEDIEVRVMIAHGWYTGHAVCDCQVLMGGININATVTALDE